MKKTIGLLIVVAMLVTLLGCDENPWGTPATNPSDPTKESTPTSGWPVYPSDEKLSVRPTLSEFELDRTNKATVSVQYLPETVNNPDDLPVLKWVCLCDGLYGGTNRVWSETAVHELNQMLADKNMPFRIQFTMVTMSEWLVDSDWFARPEVQAELQDADLVYGILSADEKMKYLLPITEYATGTAEPSLNGAVAHAMDWSAATICGEVYGIPTVAAMPYSTGWKIDSSLLNDFDLSAEDFVCDYWEMDALFADIYAKNGNEPFLIVDNDTVNISFSVLYDRIQDVNQSVLYRCMPNTYQTIGAGLAIDLSSKIPAVVSVLNTDAAYRIQQATLRYKSAGYVVSPENVKGLLSYSYVNGETAYTLTDGTTCVPVTESVLTNEASRSYVSGVAAVSGHKEEALLLLHLIAEDEDFRMQLFFGKETRDYVLKDGIYSLVKHEDGSDYSMSFLSPLAYFSGMTGDVSTNIRSPGTGGRMITYEGKTVIQTYREMMDVCDSSYLPIVFDYSGFEHELAEVDNVFRKYFMIYTNPKWMTEELSEQMLAELKDAGIGHIQEEMQRQLDEYLEKCSS